MKHTKNSLNPQFSVVVTVKNDETGLRNLLKNLQKQTVGTEYFELVLVIDESSDNSAQVAKDAAKDFTHTQILFTKNANRSEARNMGATLAQGTVLLFTDAGCLPQPEWIEEFSEAFENKKVVFASGLTLGKTRNEFEEAQLPFVLVHMDHIGENPLPATRNMGIRKSTFVQQGGFDDRLNYAEDFAFSRRLASEGVMSTYVPTAVVLWRPRTTVQDYSHMITKLTAGDVLAGITRIGLITMWVRYAFFISLSIFFPLASIVAYFLYLLFKFGRQKQIGWKTNNWTPILQVITDFSVMGGTLLGFWWIWRNRKSGV